MTLRHKQFPFPCHLEHMKVALELDTQFLRQSVTLRHKSSPYQNQELKDHLPLESLRMHRALLPNRLHLVKFQESLFLLPLIPELTPMEFGHLVEQLHPRLDLQHSLQLSLQLHLPKLVAQSKDDLRCRNQWKQSLDCN